MKHIQAMTVLKAESTEETDDFITVFVVRLMVSLTAVLLSLKS